MMITRSELASGLVGAVAFKERKRVEFLAATAAANQLAISLYGRDTRIVIGCHIAMASGKVYVVDEIQVRSLEEGGKFEKERFHPDDLWLYGRLVLKNGSLHKRKSMIYGDLIVKVEAPPEVGK